LRRRLHHACRKARRRIYRLAFGRRGLTGSCLGILLLIVVIVALAGSLKPE
jgi:hypothetical protein